MITCLSIYRIGIKGSWFVKHQSISWSKEPNIHKTSMFHESFFPKYDNFKIISTGNICLSVQSQGMIHIERPWKLSNFQDLTSPLSIYVQYSPTPLTLDVQFQTNFTPHSPPSLSLEMITNQLKKHNPRMTNIRY